jgi:hypothetical protein
MIGGKGASRVTPGGGGSWLAELVDAAGGVLAGARALLGCAGGALLEEEQLALSARLASTAPV